MAARLNTLAAYLIGPVVWLLIIIWLACMPAKASNCGQFFQHHAAVVQQVVAVPQVYYAAGRDIETEAIVQKVVRSAVPQIVAQLRQELQLGPGGLKQAVQQQAKLTAVQQYCMKCHNGPNPKGGITLDGQTQLQCFQVTQAIRKLADGSMPKGLQLNAEQKGQVMQELLDLEAKGTSPVNVPPAPPVPGELR